MKLVENRQKDRQHSERGQVQQAEALDPCSSTGLTVGWVS